jgi:L-galactose dehydrogenase/L-glyceraldehyde 3-phosphate reductase
MIERRRLGKTGLEVSALGFGCGAVGGLMVRGERGEQLRAVGRALEASSDGDGSSEENLGRALRELRARERVIVGTKVRFSPADLKDPTGAVRQSLERSLARLGIDHVDIVHLHNAVRPPAPDKDDGGIPLHAVRGEVAQALRRAVEDGLARHVGFTGVGDTADLLEVVTHPAYETVQAYLNVLNPSAVWPGASGGQQDLDGLIGKATDHGKAVIAIRVLAAGALTARPDRHPVASRPPSPLISGASYVEDVERAQRLQGVAAELAWKARSS